MPKRALPKAKTRKVEVKRVIDGNTFETSRGESVRLANVYVPEMGYPGCFAALKELKEKIAGKVVRIEPKRVDKYGYTIAILAQ